MNGDDERDSLPVETAHARSEPLLTLYRETILPGVQSTNSQA
jgi:hypothetical protein